MKKFYLLFVAVILAACSAEPVENEVLSGLDANLEGKKIKAAEAQDPMSFYAGSNDKGSLTIWNDCENLYLEITPTGDAPDEVQISFVNILPELNNGGQYSLSLDYSLVDADNLLWTIPVSEFDTENDLLIFVKAWGDDAGSSTFGAREHQYTDFIFEFSMCGDCDESFDYIQNEDGTYTFTYVPDEDIEEAELVYTFAQGAYIDGLNNWETHGQTMQKFMDLEACTTYSWTVNLDAKCSGNSPNSNLWTDFKVRDVSKKDQFGLENIVRSCK